jgi:ferrous iron transport protein A
VTGKCVPLSALAAGSRGTVCAHEESRPVPPRLADLGFVPGTELEVIRVAPLGDPVELELRGYRLCLRRDTLARVCVIPHGP